MELYSVELVNLRNNGVAYILDVVHRDNIHRDVIAVNARVVQLLNRGYETANYAVITENGGRQYLDLIEV